MERRVLGRTGRSIGVIGMGCWQLGGDWGSVDEEQAMDTLHSAVEEGVTFFDTADVYGDGRSERLLGRLLRESDGRDVLVATKMGRRAQPHTSQAYSLASFQAWTARSCSNLGVDCLDLVQLHCPPPAVYDDDSVFDALDALVQEGRVRQYGVSVETCDEALRAMTRPNVATVQIILNVFRQRPLERVLPAAAQAGVGIIARVPLASGLLTGKFDEETTFPSDDHRSYNRHGEAFDIGETFAGVPFPVGLDAAREVAAAAPPGMATAQAALRWILDQPGVSVVIPGARNAEQVQANAAAAAFPPLGGDTVESYRRIYDRRIRAYVHDRW
jgi:aryl-alcohol dehydrogenase-like predicted oxidoreductase